MTNNTNRDGLSRAGYIAILGRPNVGKSTLLNHLICQKLSITSRKPQTTRHNILGVKTINNNQMVFVDTPGIHNAKDSAINRYLNKSAISVLHDVDIVLFVVDRDIWTDEDQKVAELLCDLSVPLFIIINKMDRVEKKETMLALASRISTQFKDAEVVPVSALSGSNLDRLEQLILRALPASEHFFPADQITDRSERFLATEIIREKIIRQLGKELPYQTAVELEEYSETESLVRIRALILVEREGQKKIILGQKGSRIKRIGQDARTDLEKMLGSKVMLTLWVKVKSGWSDSERTLRSLGYSTQ